MLLLPAIVFSVCCSYVLGFSVPDRKVMFRRQSSLKMSLEKPHVAVIGAGWAGWGAAKALCEGGCKVTLIDPVGVSEMSTPDGKPIEAGQKGFWYDYPNIAKLVADIGLKEEDLFTPFLNSSFYSPNGLEATAPVFSNFPLPQLPSPLGQVFASFPHFKRLPIHDRATITGLLFAMADIYRNEETFEAYDRMSAYDLFANLGVSKRLIDDFLRPTLLVGLFKPPEELSAAVAMELLYYYALAHQNSFDVRWLKKGTIASEIFRPLSNYLRSKYDITVLGSSKVTKLLLESDASSFASAEDNGRSRQKDRITGVEYVATTPPLVKTSPTSSTTNNNNNANPPISSPRKQLLDKLDAVVLAVGTKGLKSILQSSSDVTIASPSLNQAATLKSIDCISCRLWLDTTIPTLSPANVLANFPALRGAGGTYFNLDQIQGENSNNLWGPTSNVRGGSVIGVDFYNAGALAMLPNDALLKTIMEELLPAAEPAFRNAKVMDASIQRYPEAVSWFSPGSYVARPRTKIAELDNVYCAGDWVVMQDTDTSDLADVKNNDNNNIFPFSIPQIPSSQKTNKLAYGFPTGEHGSKGLCQERAYVSGIVAANQIIERANRQQSLQQLLTKSSSSPSSKMNNPESYYTARPASSSTMNSNPTKNSNNNNGGGGNSKKMLKKATIVPVREDELQVKLSRQLSQLVLGSVQRVFNGWNVLPWLR